MKVANVPGRIELQKHDHRRSSSSDRESVNLVEEESKSTNEYSEQPMQAADEQSRIPSSLTKSHKIIIVTMAISNFSSNLAFATIAPFFPKEATEKGASALEIGFIFGVFQLVIFIVSPIYGSLMSTIGARFLYLSGLFICCVCIVLFGLLDASPPGRVYVVLCFICRIVDANGTAMLTTASFAIMADTFPNRLSMVMGILGASTALGVMCGPAFGGALYEAGGFKTPFFVVGGALLVAFICSYFSIPNIDGVFRGEKFYVLLRIPDAVLSFFQILSANLHMSFLDPTLAKRILAIDSSLGEAAVGGIFLVAPAIYALLAPLVGYLWDKTGNGLKCITLAGWMIITASQLLLGPTPLLAFLYKSTWLLILSLSLLGFGLLGCWLPAYQQCLKAALKQGYPDNSDTYGIVGGLLGSGAGLGSFIGPAAGGYLADTIGFPWAATCSSGVAVVMAVVASVFLALERLKRTPAASKDSSINCEAKARQLHRTH